MENKNHHSVSQLDVLRSYYYDNNDDNDDDDDDSSRLKKKRKCLFLWELMSWKGGKWPIRESCANGISWLVSSERDYHMRHIFTHCVHTHTQTQTHTLYLCQPDILLLNGVLQTVAEGSGQQQVCRLADHIIYLRRAVDGHTHTHTHRHTHRHKQKRKTENQWLCRSDLFHFSPRSAASERQYKQFKWNFSVCQSLHLENSLHASQFKWVHYHVMSCQDH